MEFHTWVRQILKSLRKGDLQLANKNVSFSPELFDKAMQKYLPHPNTLNENVWIKNIASPLIKTVENSFKITSREALDMIYDTMTDKFGFYPCCARNEYKDKYNVLNISVLSAIADSPTYKQTFVMAVNQIMANLDGMVEKNQDIPIYLDEFDKVVYPLAKKLKDNTPHYSYTLRRVYSKIKTPQGWKNTRTRNKCFTNKAVIMKNPQLFKTFVKAVNRMMEEK